MPWIENEEDGEFIEFVKNYNCQNRPRVMELLNQYANKDIYIFKERKEANEFLFFLSQKYYNKVSPICLFPGQVENRERSIQYGKN